MHIAHIPADMGSPVTIHEVERVELSKLYELTGADTVESFDLSRDEQEATAFLSETGKLDGLPVNRRADWLAHMFGSIRQDDVIVGDIVVCGAPDEDGESTGLTSEWREFLTNATTFEEVALPA